MNKTVLITGSSTGIGRAAVEYFQKKGWNVAATMRNPERATALAKLPNVACISLDVMDINSIKKGIKKAIDQFGGIDVIVNNAGYGMVGPFEASTTEQVERQFATNVFGLMNTCREMVTYFREKGGGSILNVASMGGRITFPLYSVYHATKWAVEGFSESLQYEVRQFDIKVKIIEPGPIKTDFYSRSMDIVSKPGLTAYDEYVNKAMPNMNKVGETAPGPEVVAKVIYKAATDGKFKMRYTANSAMILSMRKVLPDCAFQGIVSTVVTR